MLRVRDRVPHVLSASLVRAGHCGPVEVAPLQNVASRCVGDMTALDALPVVAHYGHLNPMILRALFPSLADAGILHGVGADCRAVCSRDGQLVGDNLFGPENGKDKVVLHDVKVPGDYGAFVVVLN